jgi:hypothetical protein
MFERFLMIQANDVRALQDNHPEAMIVWAGDFNQSLDGPNTGGSNRGRALLSETLEIRGSRHGIVAPIMRSADCALST